MVNLGYQPDSIQNQLKPKLVGIISEVFSQTNSLKKEDTFLNTKKTFGRNSSSSEVNS